MALICSNVLKNLPTAVARPTLNALPLIPIRHATQKHWNPKWKKLRSLKVIKVKLPDLQKKDKTLMDMSPEEQRAFFKERGMQPTRPWKERDLFLTCTRSIFEPYVPPEGDGKVSALTKEGAKQQIDFLKKKTVTWKSIRKVRSYDDAFELYPDFINLSQDVYLKAHELLTDFKNNKDELIKYVTERAYADMVNGIENKTVRWKFIQSLEPPKIVHARTTQAITDDNYFAQITVRMHTQQTLAIYDRFGRLMYGSEVVAKDVLEYVVFEKHIVNVYGSWRLHDKIIPDWAPPREPTAKTRIFIPSGPTQAESSLEVASAEVSTSSPQEKSTEKSAATS